MSWFTIIIGNIEQSEIEKVKLKHPPNNYELRLENLYVLAGGIEETTLIDSSNSRGGGYFMWNRFHKR